MGFGYGIKNINERRHKWSCFIDGNNAIVDVDLCDVFRLWREEPTQD
jgi:hypothetical protein